MKNRVTPFVGDESGATAIEYGLIAAGLSIVIAAAVAIGGEALNTVLFGKIVDAVSQ
ncbi:MAG: Flp family type IVb pilin [Parvibaculum sp.]|nr:Flp family type IVb pilin [Parvibaculum sp.]